MPSPKKYFYKENSQSNKWSLEFEILTVAIHVIQPATS